MTLVKMVKVREDGSEKFADVDPASVAEFLAGGWKETKGTAKSPSSSGPAISEPEKPVKPKRKTAAKKGGKK